MGDLTDAEAPVGQVIDGARREADAYRGDSPQPLAGYATVLVVYTTVVAVATLVAMVTGRRLPARWPLQDLITVTLGTHKLSRTITKDAVTSPLRAPFTRFKGAGGPAEVMEEVRGESPLRHSLGELLTCPFCLDMWVATGFAIGLVFAPRYTRLIAGVFTVLTGADFLQLVYAMAQQSAEG
ncbi:DUF1360 domain-containing protein [Mycobacterium sp. Marseille-P9652]|uniref:DUF1360 domain-containing protein n=1 Tax=Mycobacterium sp. Marseille-P9652 TaxID=2654950 RepID=UPI0012E71426|nr:DUF1360 domain-containing protein [Mycobacterium sp. Marseille-P9652]